MNEKFNAAKGAFDLISKHKESIKIGIGTGSTSDFFTKNFLPKLKDKIKCIYSSSLKTSGHLEELGFVVDDLNLNPVLDFYVDGADEVDTNHFLIKGGGGAHFMEKKVASKANKFICIVDSSKHVHKLGAFPLPLEVEKNKLESVLISCKKFGNTTIRKELSDNKNYLIDLHNLVIDDPLYYEKLFQKIDGVIEVGIFAEHKPHIVVTGFDYGYELKES